MFKYRKPKEYTSRFEAETQALQLSYRHGVEYYVCEFKCAPGTFLIKKETHMLGVFQMRRDTLLFVSTRQMGWHRGLHKELGDDSPCRIMCKSEVPKRRYNTW